ncbi:methyltransferase domain-containing protein [Acidiferrimicrobium sp. IK]|uniref:class I SAM-dependent methyltransferase n=1 Tax=Acidiferrimicrobium sp. IK TaxID=2871700 RepID=UPI0021CB8D0E|nr:methyltransferase domain-containing protein [Acidiferrimicrobium sp. IK]MCU4185777.1 methyltransferase domain-containing protein [Acidiferrimicrobium sp. IK]
MLGSHRYRLVAPVYDAVSLERPFYQRGRRRAVDLLSLAPGHVVVDLGCGTGLSFPFLQAHIGPSGTIVGIDTSEAMLAQARRRAQRAGWDNVRLVNAPASRLDAALADARVSPGGVDALLAVYALSVIDHYPETWDQIRQSLPPGTRMAIADLSLGPHPALQPLWRLLCALGGSDPNRRPWQPLEDHTHDLRRQDYLAGHIVVTAATLDPRPPARQTP